MAQSSDGIFYLGTGDGLYTFDGTAFSLVPAPEGSPMARGNVTALTALPNGDLLVGYGSSAGLGLLEHGKLIDLKMPNPPPVVIAAYQTPDHAIWVAYGGYANRLFRFKDGRWADAAKAYQLPSGQVLRGSVARDGTLWLAVKPFDSTRPSGRTVFLKPNSDHFRDAGLSDEGSPVFDPSGRLWSMGPSGFLLARGPPGQPYPSTVRYDGIPGTRNIETGFDPWNGLWASTQSVGIFRISNATAGPSAGGAVERFMASDGLTSNAANTLLVDRENNVWVGTDGGLDRFRRTAITSETAIPAPDNNGLAMARTGDGIIHIVSGGQLFDVRPGFEPQMVRRGLNGSSVVCDGRDGSIWVTEARRLLHRANGRETAYSFPAGQTDTNNCGVDQAGHLWMLFGNEVFRLDADGWHKLRGLPANSDIWDLATGPEGDLFLSIGLKSLFHLVGTRGQIISADKLHVGQISGLFSTPDALFVGGSDGLARIHQGRIQWLDIGANSWARSVRGVAQAADGKTWFVGRQGIVQATSTAMIWGFGGRGRAVPIRPFDARDGVEIFTQKVGYRAQNLAAGGDGRIWFLRSEGAAVLDSRSLSRNRIVPTVAILSLKTAEQNFTAPAQAELRAGTRAVDIAYAAYSLAVPDRVKFRYRLEGVDQDWIDPGARRLASYANLAPGRYVFHVIASNDDGAWNRTGAKLVFNIQPTFAQGWPFRVLCMIALLALFWFLYSLRLRAISSRLAAGFEARTKERERIARELHDTLLQAVAGLTMKVESASLVLPTASPPRQVLEEALDIADGVIAEGRARVRALRDGEVPTDLAQAIEECAARRVLSPTVDFEVQTEGKTRALVAPVIEELVGIVNEALYNAATHAAASRISISLIFGRTNLTIVVADDGVGIDAKVAAYRKTQGHYGLQGMSERARMVKAKLSVTNLKPGTEVRVRVPATVAYAGRRAWRDFVIGPGSRYFRGLSL